MATFFKDVLMQLRDVKDKGIVFVKSGKSDVSMSYSEVFNRSLKALAFLQAKGIKPGMELIFQVADEEDTITMCWACLLGGIVPVPLNVATNFELKMQLLRIWDIIETPYLLTNKAISDKLQDFFKENANKEVYEDIQSKTLLFDDFENISEQKPVIHESEPDDTALLLFSSGSTGDPKAVILTHHNLMVNTSSVKERWNMDESEDCSLIWMSLTHAMGLILCHFTSVLAKIRQVIMQTALFVAEPLLWLKKADEYKATLLSAPNFGLKHMIDTIGDECNENIDLSKVKMICNAAEPISISVCNKFLDVFQKFGLKRNTILPLLGMTEVTAGVTAADIGEELKVFYLDRRNIEIGNKIIQIDPIDHNAVSFVDLGEPFSCCTLRICDDKNNSFEEGTIGYIQVRGETLFKGYYKNKEATNASVSKDGWLTTGDLGFLLDGRLTITGRAKDIIFVNGQNFYPHDIERVADTAEGVNGRKVVVCAVYDQENQKDGVGVFVEYKDDVFDFIEIIKNIRKTVNVKMGLEVYDVVPVATIPKTGSGKILRYHLGRKYNNGEFAGVLHKINAALFTDIVKKDKEVAKAATETEERLLKIWQDALNNKAIDVCASYFEFGVNSLMMLKISGIIKSEFGVNVDIGTLFECQNIRSLAKFIEQKDSLSEGNIYPSIVADKANIYEKFPLTEIQAAYLLGRESGYELGGIATHSYIELKTKLDIQRLNRALQKLINKHYMMRAVFIDNQQQILEKVPDYIIEVEKLSDLSESKIQERLISERNRMSHHVFAPDKWPLFEFKAMKCDEQAHYLLIGLDMLIIDAGSLDSIASELMEFYDNEELEAEEITFSFRDYVLAYKEFKNTDTYKNDKKFWMGKLNDFPSAPNLPTKVDISEIEKPVFKRVQKLFDKEKWEKLKSEAALHNVTPSATLCTAFLEVLAYWSNQPRLAISLTLVNRYPFNNEVEKLIGDFTSVIPLAADLTEKEGFWNKAKAVQATIMAGLEHRHYDGVEFVRELSILNNYVNKAAIPVVFSSLLSNDIWGKWNKIGDTNYIISQTSQVYLDYQASEIDGQLFINWDYVSNLLDEQMVEDMFEQYADQLLSICDSTEVIDVTVSDGFGDLLRQYNDTKEDIAPGLLHVLFEQQAKNSPTNIAIIDGDKTMTYSELNEKSNRVAGKLRELGIKCDDLVGVLAVRCKESIVNIMGILKAGGAYVPIDPQYPRERVDYILENSKCTIMLEPDFYEKNGLESYSGKNVQSDVGFDNIAYVIYTSGSTGKPKGVVITHRAAANTIIDINRKYNVNEKDRILGISSMCFDLSVYDIFGSLLSGAALVQVPDQRDVMNLFDVIQKENITIWNSVPAIMDMMLENIDSKSKNSNLRLVLLSGDWIPVKLPNKITKCFCNSKVISLGGATEASIWSIYYPIKEVDRNWTSIPYGMPLANQTYYVLNYENKICPLNIEGELYIGGVGVAKEYYNDIEKTKASMLQHPEYGRLYKTGDYGAFRRSGSGELYIEFRGRKDYQVKISGHRIELTEIETNLLNHEEVESCIVIDKTDSNNKKFLCAYVVPAKEKVDATQLKAYLAEYLPDYMVPNHFVKIEKIPLTSNGKVDRKALPEVQQLKQEEKEYIAPRNEIEKDVHRICCDVLDASEIGVFDSLFGYNLDSIKTVTIIAKLEKELNTKIKFRDFTRKNNISEIAMLVQAASSNKREVVQAVMKHDEVNAYEPFAVTEIQNAYIMGRSDQFEISGISAHFYGEIDGDFDIERLNRSVQKVIDRHAMLRTVFISENKQQILKDVPRYNIEVLDLRGVKEGKEQILLEERERMSHHIFQIDKWPLFELKAARIDECANRLMVSYDLLISDGASAFILGNEIMEYCRNEQLEKKIFDCTFRDYMVEYEKFRAFDTYKESKDYWLNKLSEFPPAPQLPVKVSPSEISKPHFTRLSKKIHKNKWEKVKEIAQQKSITTSAVLCTAYAKVLSHWSNQDRLAINMTVFNRYPFHECINDMVGDFTSTILVDVKFGSNNSFWEEAAATQEAIMEALEHRHFDGVEFTREILKHNNYAAAAGMPIVFTSMLNNKQEDSFNLGIFTYSVSQTPQVYLDYQVSETNDGLAITWDYVMELFDEEMLESMFKDYIGILDSIGENEKTVNSTLLKREKHLINQYNDTYEDIKPGLLHQLFEEQVIKNADNIAIIDGDKTMTYSELNEKSNRVARKLMELGIKCDDLVGILAVRCKEAIVNIMGILKAGGAYVPIDPQYPRERVDYILENSKCTIMLEPDFYEKNGLESYSGKNVQSDVGFDNIAYVIYTSGSTGKPKGVVITHRAVVNTIIDINRKYNVNEKDRILGISSMCFDLSVYDIFGSLLSGAALVQVPDQRDVMNLFDVIQKENITVWNSVPAIMDMMIQSIEGSISYEEFEQVAQDPDDCSETEECPEQDKLYFWSPAVAWDEENHIDDYVYVDSLMLTIFPRFYFFMQKGRKLEEIYSGFSEIAKSNLKAFVQELIDNNVLVSAINNPHEVFKLQEKLFDNKYDEDIMFNPQAYEDFKEKQLNRKFIGIEGEKIQLSRNYKFPGFIEDRKTHRKFNEAEKIPFEYISQLLSVFMQNKKNSHIQYYYPCAGGLYPIDIFIYVKEGRIEKLKKGIYYYSPIDNSICVVNEGCTITDDSQFYTNKEIFNSSAATIYMVYNAEATMPKYGGSGYLYACIDTGIMTSTLVNVAEMLNLGTCSIGDMNFESIKDNFKLNRNQVLIHSVEIGLKENTDIKEIEFTESQLLRNEADLKAPVSYKIEKSTKEEVAAVAVRADRKLNKIIENTSLRLVMLSGDWIPLSLPKKIKNSFKNAEVISLGGATEASIWSIYYPVTEENKKWKSIPYGKPLANQQFYVLDYKGDLCHAGVAGELYIGGVGLAKCYYNEIEKTNQSFIEHPALGRIYKTGDYGRLQEDGVIEFLGRKDQQVKIRGHRIELGEIENCLMKHSDVINVSVVDFTDKGGKKYLCAYIVSDKKININELKAHVSKELPEYMLPAFFLQINTIPLSSNGKVDKKSLPKPDMTKAANKERLKPRNELEEKLLDIWKVVLKTDDVGVNDNFFEVGGDSMLLTNVHSRIDQIYPKMLRITDLFTNTSISALSEFLHKKIVLAKKRLEVHGVKLPMDYLAERGNIAKNSTFAFKLDEVLTGKLKNIANKANISIEDLLTAFYMYTINQVSGESTVNIQTMTDQKNTIFSIKVDFAQLTQFEQLFQKIQDKGSADSYEINDIQSIGMKKDSTSVIPAFMKRSMYTSNINIMEFYDYMLMIEENSNEISFTCEYNGSKLEADKAKSLIYDYMKLLKAYAERA